MASLPSLAELGLLGPSCNYAPWWTTLEGAADTDADTDAVFQAVFQDVFQGHKSERHQRSRKRRAVSPDDQDRPTLSLHIPDADVEVPELVPELDASDSSDSSPASSPEPSPHTSPETAAADLALPIRRLPPHGLLPLPPMAMPVPAIKAEPRSRNKTAREREDDEAPAEREREKDLAKRKRESPTCLANLLSPTPNVYCLYKFDRVDQLGGKRRGLR